MDGPEARPGDGESGAGWTARIRRAPLGVLILGTLLFFLGAGLVLGGVYLGLSGRAVEWMAAGSSLLLGPLLLYVAFRLVLLARWTWLAMVLLLVLLLASALARALTSPEVPWSPLAEMGVELAFLGYLARRPIRRAFQR